MKEFKRISTKIIAVVLSFALVLTSFSFVTVSYAAEDTQGPEVDLESITLSSQTITNPYENPTVKVKVTDESGVAEVTLYYSINGKDSAATACLSFNEDTRLFEGSIAYRDLDCETGTFVGCYGKYDLDSIMAMDVYGNLIYLDNLHVPNGNFEVIGGIPDDMSAPVINVDNITVNKVVEKGESAVITIPIEDDSIIRYGLVAYCTKDGDYVHGQIRRKSDGTYQAELNFDMETEYQLNLITVIDANYNQLLILNSDCSLYNEEQNGQYFNQYDEVQIRALDFLNIQYGEYVPTELTASIKSMVLSSSMMNREAEETLTVTFNASSPLKSADFQYTFESDSMLASRGGMITKLDDYTFRFTLPAEYYGLWKLRDFTVKDDYGNQFHIIDDDEWPWTECLQVDLSNGNYYVGIVDSETGVGVSDTKLDDTTELEVDEESLKSDLYEELVEDDSIGVALYDVDVEGSRDDETVMSIVAPEGFINGDEVEIVHKRHDGSIETFDAEVKHGRLTIETDEFSPFLVQIDKNHKHRYVKKEAVPATCTKQGKTEGQYCALCGEVSVAQKTVNAKGHKYSTSYTIDKNATTASSGSKSKHCTRSGCSAKTSVTTIPKISTVILSASSYTYSGEQKNPFVIVKDSKGNELVKDTDYTVKTPDGRKNAGTYTYKIIFKGKYSGTKDLKMTIKPKKISKLTLSKVTYVYDGEAKRPTVTVKAGSLTPASKETKSNDNITITYEKGRTQVGTYKVTVKGKGNYTGTLTNTFKVNPRSISKATLSKTTYVYTGKALKPTVTVKNSSGTKLKSSDYTVTYKNNTKVGKATATIKGKGNYKGTITKTFIINPKATTIRSVTAAKKAFTVKWKKVSSQATGYEIQYATNSKFTTGKKTVKVTSYKTTSKKITKLKAKKTYYVKVRTYKTVDGKKYYSSWSDVKKVKTK